MVYSIILGVLFLFIFISGIMLLSDGLLNVTSYNLKNILYKFTKTPLCGILTGTLFTAVIQSSSSATVIFISLLNARMISLKQALGLIFGSNIGTTITGQIISFNIEKSAFPFAITGFVLWTLGKDRTKHTGRALFGLALLLFGLSGIKETFKTFQDLAVLNELVDNVANNPVRGFLWGVFFTSIIQSSSAAGAVVISMAERGMIDINAAIPIILGQNVGTCVTALIASIGGSYNGKRAAAAHFLFNFFGSVLAMVFYINFLKEAAIFIAPSNIKRQIANTHTMFNIVNTLIFLPWVHYFSRFLCWLIPGEDEH